MSNRFEPLGPDDVVSVSEHLIVNHLTFQVNEFMDEVRGALMHYAGSDDEQAKLTGEGSLCKVLRPGKSWQKGKLRLRLEFCPDEPEDSNLLDEFRE